MDTLLQDLRYAVRSLRRAPTFAISAVTILALGIGATTAVFAVLNALLLRPLPLPQPEQMVDVTQWSFGREIESFSYPIYQALSEESRGIELALWEFERYSLRTGAGVETVYGMVVSGNYFHALGASPVRGRFFTPADDDEAHPAPVA
ncbi:MAG TPA: ABC transporter permease, partial [Longimicrobiaceae bacterium]|nr:ABC transporter permease [Longimicrobiaceae bacterium]